MNFGSRHKSPEVSGFRNHFPDLSLHITKCSKKNWWWLTELDRTFVPRPSFYSLAFEHSPFSSNYSIDCFKNLSLATVSMSQTRQQSPCSRHSHFHSPLITQQSYLKHQVKEYKIQFFSTLQPWCELRFLAIIILRKLEIPLSWSLTWPLKW